jgi:phage-related protein
MAPLQPTWHMQGGRVVCFSQQMAAAKNHAAVAVYPAERFFFFEKEQKGLLARPRLAVRRLSCLLIGLLPKLSNFSACFVILKIFTEWR